MHPETLKNILSLCEEVDGLLANAEATADPKRLEKIQFLCNLMCGHDTYITEKAKLISSRAAIYLSARRHQSEARGADGLIQDMRYRYLKAIRDQVDSGVAG